MKLAKQILIEEEKNIRNGKKKWMLKIRTTNFDKEEWDEFVKSQYQ